MLRYQNSNHVHFLFMRRPATSLTHQRYVSDMPIILLEIKTAFGPEDTAAMTAAFEEALKRLNIADREALMATSVAKKIVRLCEERRMQSDTLDRRSRQLVCGQSLVSEAHAHSILYFLVSVAR